MDVDNEEVHPDIRKKDSKKTKGEEKENKLRRTPKTTSNEISLRYVTLTVM